MLYELIAKHIKRYGMKLFLEQFIKYVKASGKEEYVQKLGEDLQTALDNYKQHLK
jgi:hypothetical protein